jgi:GNAT superfamily N-acetyltransferase
MIGAELPGPPPDGFLELPGMVYADDAGWLPEEPERIALLFSSLNPWLAQVDAHAFCIPGAVRAAVFARPGYVLDGRKAAWFGYWESMGDHAAEELVMAEVRRWARAAGAQLLMGPIDFSTVRHCRALLAAEPGAMPFVGEPWNPLRYGPSWQALGFEPHVSYVSIVLDRDDIAGLVAYKACTREKLAARGYSFETFDPTMWTKRTDELFELANAVFADNVGFMPISWQEFECYILPGLAATVDPGRSVLALGPDGDVAGFILMYPHYAPLCRGADAISVSSLRFEDHAAVAPPAMVLKTGGTMPDHRRSGLAHAMVSVAAERALTAGVEKLFVSTMRADNRSRLLFPRYRCERWYAIFASPL